MNNIEDFLNDYVSRGNNCMIMWLSGDLEVADPDDIEYNDILSDYLGES